MNSESAASPTDATPQVSPSPSPTIQPSPAQTPQIVTIAQGLNIYTLQGVAIGKQAMIVPTLDGQLLQVSLKGKVTVLVDLLKAEVGIPFGITETNGDFVVTVSGYLPVHYLVRVKANGALTTIADLSQSSGFYGAPFGVAAYNGEYIVTVSTDVVDSTSALLRVSATGKVGAIANLSEFGIPFGVIATQRGFVVAQQNGQLLQISPGGKVSVMVDLLKSGFGIPFNLAARKDDLVVTTNAGLIVRVNPQGVPSTLVNLLKARLGIPSGIVVSNGNLIVTTNAGYLLQINL